MIYAVCYLDVKPISVHALLLIVCTNSPLYFNIQYMAINIGSFMFQMYIVRHGGGVTKSVFS